MKYISKTFILFLIILIPYFCHSQPGKFQIGIEGGPCLSVLRQDLLLFPRNFDDLGLGGTIGVAFRYNVDEKYAIRTGLSWERQGFQNKSGDFHYHFDYLILPVVFNVNLLKRNLAFINFGPYMGYLISQGLRSTPYDGFFGKWKYEKFDFGITMGLGVNLPLFHQFGTTIEIRNNYGLLNIQKPLTVTGYYGEYGNAGKIYTNSTIILIGLVYNLENKKSGNKTVSK